MGPGCVSGGQEAHSLWKRVAESSAAVTWSIVHACLAAACAAPSDHRQPPRDSLSATTAGCGRGREGGVRTDRQRGRNSATVVPRSWRARWACGRDLVHIQKESLCFQHMQCARKRKSNCVAGTHCERQRLQSALVSTVRLGTASATVQAQQPLLQQTCVRWK